jgi:hypothetical protein
MTDTQARMVEQLIEEMQAAADPSVTLQKVTFNQLCLWMAALLALPASDVGVDAILEAIEDVSDGREVSDFMLSFHQVRRVDDLYRMANRPVESNVGDLPASEGVPCVPDEEYPQACNLAPTTHTTLDGVERCDLCGCPCPLPASEGQEEEEETAHAYLSRLLKSYAPQCEPLPSLTGLCSQIDNLLCGMRPVEPSHD